MDNNYLRFINHLLNSAIEDGDIEFAINPISEVYAKLIKRDYGEFVRDVFRQYQKKDNGYEKI